MDIDRYAINSMMNEIRAIAEHANVVPDDETVDKYFRASLTKIVSLTVDIFNLLNKEKEAQ